MISLYPIDYLESIKKKIIFIKSSTRKLLTEVACGVKYLGRGKAWKGLWIF